MYLTEINHLALITDDMEKTIRFYRDLLCMELTICMGHNNYRHYFFKTGNNHIAFFSYNGARPMKKKFHGSPSTDPIGFDHVSISVDSKQDLFALKDRLEAAGLNVEGAVDHGFIWSIYFFDNNNIPLEASWKCCDLIKIPAIADDDLIPAATEGSNPQKEFWPDVINPTPPEKMTAYPGNGYQTRKIFMDLGMVIVDPDISN